MAANKHLSHGHMIDVERGPSVDDPSGAISVIYRAADKLAVRVVSHCAARVIHLYAGLAQTEITIAYNVIAAVTQDANSAKVRPYGLNPEILGEAIQANTFAAGIDVYVGNSRPVA